MVEIEHVKIAVRRFIAIQIVDTAFHPLSRPIMGFGSSHPVSRFLQRVHLRNSIVCNRVQQVPRSGGFHVI
jgi:hypothetical protein